MAVNNLGELRALVKDWANRKDIPDSVYNSFINLAQDRANRVLRIPVLEGYNNNLTINSEGAIALPEDYLEAKAVSIDYAGRTYDLERKALPTVVGMQTDVGLPKYFARQQNRFLIAPLNTEVTSVKLYYYIVVNNLVNDADTNWFVEQGTDLLLYGALAELALYTKNTEEAQLFESKFRGSASELEAMAMKAVDKNDWTSMRKRGGDKEKKEDGVEKEGAEKETDTTKTASTNLLDEIEVPTEIEVTAWYTMQIPVNQGPGEYWGLPGLILEVNADKTTILCSKIVLNPEEKEEINVPSKGKEVTREEYSDTVTKKMEEMREMYGGRGGRGGKRKI